MWKPIAILLICVITWCGVGSLATPWVMAEFQQKIPKLYNGSYDHLYPEKFPADHVQECAELENFAKFWGIAGGIIAVIVEWNVYGNRSWSHRTTVCPDYSITGYPK